MCIERKPFVWGLHKVPAPAAHALGRKLLLPLDPSYVLNHRIAEHHVKTTSLETGFASIADNVGRPIHFIAMFIYVENREPRAHWDHGPVKSSPAHIQHGSVLVNRKTLA